MEVKTVYVTKEQMDASSVKAECLLLATKGTYYYGEAFQKFIEIEEWEYHRILGNPHLYYFSTALKKHFAWEDARRKGTTLAFSGVLGQTNNLNGPPESENLPPCQNNESAMKLRYKTGEGVRLGDQVRYGRSPGTVMSVVYDRSGHTTGFSIFTVAHSFVFLDKAGEDLEFLGRGYPNISPMT
jgi:hypothetical protein